MSAHRESQPGNASDALAQIDALISNGARPTVNERNAFEHFTALNQMLMQIRDIAREPRPQCGVQTGDEKMPTGRPVAFRVPRVIDDKISKTEFRLFDDEDEARRAACDIGADYDGLYLVADRRAAFFAQPDPSLLSSAQRVCARCDCETNGEEVLVNGEIWCHPCADADDASPLPSTHSPCGCRACRAERGELDNFSSSPSSQEQP